MPADEVFCQFFELFAVHGALARLALRAREGGVEVVQRQGDRAAQHHRHKAVFAGQLRFIELAADILFDALCLLFVRLDLFHELAVQGVDAEVEAAAVGALGGEVAHLHAGAADIDQHRALVSAVKAVGDVVAQRLFLPVYGVDGHARAVQDRRAHLFKIFHKAQRRGGDDVQHVRAQADALVLHRLHGLDHLVDAAGREFAPLHVVLQREAGAVAEDDLGDAVVDLRHDHRRVAGTDVDDSVFHLNSLYDKRII